MVILAIIFALGGTYLLATDDYLAGGILVIIAVLLGLGARGRSARVREVGSTGYLLAKARERQEVLTRVRTDGRRLREEMGLIHPDEGERVNPRRMSLAEILDRPLAGEEDDVDLGTAEEPEDASDHVPGEDRDDG